MVRQLLERVTARAVAVTIVVVIFVAVVPITVLSVAPGDDSAGRETAAASHARTPTSTPTKVPPRVKFKSDADALIAALKNSEAACLASVTTLVAQAGLQAYQSKPILDTANSQLDGGVLPLIGKVQRDEDEVASTRTLTPKQLGAYTGDLDRIRHRALGSATQQGSIAILCSTVTVQVQREIAILAPPPVTSSTGGAGGQHPLMMVASDFLPLTRY